MRLWTIQPIDFYDNLVLNGNIQCTREHIDKDFEPAYKWLVKEMNNRIGYRPQKNSFPLWAWYQYNDKSKKPDLRSSGYLPKGTEGVRIEFEKPESEVLLSDFHLWHYVINYWYLPRTRKDSLIFEDKLLQSNVDFIDKEMYPPKLKQLIENSWSKIFDMQFDNEYVSEKSYKKSIQATFWTLCIDEILNVDFFRAR